MPPLGTFLHTLLTSFTVRHRFFVTEPLHFLSALFPTKWLLKDSFLYHSYTLPKLFDLSLNRCYVRVARLCLKAPVKLPLIIRKHSVFSVLLSPFCELFGLLCGSFKILLQFLYYNVKAFTFNFVFLLKLFPYFILLWSSLQQFCSHRLLSLSTLLKSRAVHHPVDYHSTWLYQMYL